MTNDLGREAMTIIERDRRAHRWIMPHEQRDHTFRLNLTMPFAAHDDGSEFHRPPPQLCFFLVGEPFFLHVTCSLLLLARSLLADARTRSKRAPRNFSSSSLYRNRSTVEESTSSTQPSN